jgi:hypothetical protein
MLIRRISLVMAFSTDRLALSMINIGIGHLVAICFVYNILYRGLREVCEWYGYFVCMSDT